MKWLISASVCLTLSCFQPWTPTGLYRCGGGCPDDLFCDDGVCCRLEGEPACPTEVPKSGRCANGELPKTFYADHDDDSFGTAADSRLACSRPLTITYVENADDCDDTSASAHPGGSEICDGRDNNCNGSVDEGLTPQQTFYRDADGDTFGDTADTTSACAAPPGFVTSGGDCGPAEAARHPGATELCNGLDDDCNGQMDDAVTVGVGQTCDGGLGTCAAGTTTCAMGAITCRPNALPSKDVCDGFDNNCNGAVDEQPDCGGPNQLLLSGVSVTGAFKTGDTSGGPSSPSSCLKGMGSMESWTAQLGPWSGTGNDWHLWFAEAPPGTTWDLSKAGLKLHLRFSGSMLRPGTPPWTGYNQPVVLLCNTNAASFSRYRPLDQLMNSTNIGINADIPLAGGGSITDGGWLLASGGADLAHVFRIEVLLQPGDNAMATKAGFSINFNASTGFKP